MFLLLLKFICSCTCTRTIAGQQQHETVTAAATTTTTQSNLHKLLSVQDVTFPIQQLHMNTSSENMNSFQVWVSLCPSSEKLTKLFTSSEPWGVYLNLHTSSEHMNSFWLWVSVCTSSEKLTELFTSSETRGDI